MHDEVTDTYSWPKVEEIEQLCYYDEDCNKKAPGSVCGSVWEKYGLDPFEVDDVIENPLISYGIPGFDNFGQALLTVF